MAGPLPPYPTDGMFPARLTHVRFSTVQSYDGATLVLHAPCPPVARGVDGIGFARSACAAEAEGAPAAEASGALNDDGGNSGSSSGGGGGGGEAGGGGGRETYDVGGYLGGGSSGVVYEVVHTRSQRHYALKMLHPMGYRLVAQTLLRKFIVGVQGAQPSADVLAGRAPLLPAHVWWLVDPATRQVIPAYADVRSGGLKEVPLTKCVQLWGWNPPELATVAGGSAVAKRAEGAGPAVDGGATGPGRGDGGDTAVAGGGVTNVARVITVANMAVDIPRVPRKYLHFLAARARVYREIDVMVSLPQHRHVLGLRHVCEQVESHQARMFLVLDMAMGGNLFDLVPADTGCDERVAAAYMRQLLSGVAFCHMHGVVHRDLKLENVLIADDDGDASDRHGEGDGAGMDRGGHRDRNVGDATRCVGAPGSSHASAFRLPTTLSSTSLSASCTGEDGDGDGDGDGSEAEGVRISSEADIEGCGDPTSRQCLKIADFGLSALMEVAEKPDVVSPETPVMRGQSEGVAVAGGRASGMRMSLVAAAIPSSSSPRASDGGGGAAPATPVFILPLNYDAVSGGMRARSVTPLHLDQEGGASGDGSHPLRDPMPTTPASPSAVPYASPLAGSPAAVGGRKVSLASPLPAHLAGGPRARSASSATPTHQRGSSSMAHGGAGGGSSTSGIPSPAASTSGPSPVTPPPPSPYLTRLKTVVGSPFYVAPEVLASGATGYDATKADSWSLGVIMHAIMAGALPFQENVQTCARYQRYASWVAERDAAVAAAAAAAERAEAVAELEDELMACVQRRQERRARAKAAGKEVKRLLQARRRQSHEGVPCTVGRPASPHLPRTASGGAGGDGSPPPATAPPTPLTSPIPARHVSSESAQSSSTTATTSAGDGSGSSSGHGGRTTSTSASVAGAVATPRTVLGILSASRLARTSTHSSAPVSPAGPAVLASTCLPPPPAPHSLDSSITASPLAPRDMPRAGVAGAEWRGRADKAGPMHGVVDAPAAPVQVCVDATAPVAAPSANADGWTDSPCGEVTRAVCGGASAVEADAPCAPSSDVGPTMPNSPSPLPSGGPMDDTSALPPWPASQPLTTQWSFLGMAGNPNPLATMPEPISAHVEGTDATWHDDTPASPSITSHHTPHLPPSLSNVPSPGPLPPPPTLITAILPDAGQPTLPPGVAAPRAPSPADARRRRHAQSPLLAGMASPMSSPPPPSTAGDSALQAPPPPNDMDYQRRRKVAASNTGPSAVPPGGVVATITATTPASHPWSRTGGKMAATQEGRHRDSHGHDQHDNHHGPSGGVSSHHHRLSPSSSPPLTPTPCHPHQRLSHGPTSLHAYADAATGNVCNQAASGKGVKSGAGCHRDVVVVVAGDGCHGGHAASLPSPLLVLPMSPVPSPQAVADEALARAVQVVVDSETAEAMQLQVGGWEGEDDRPDTEAGYNDASGVATPSTPDTVEAFALMDGVDEVDAGGGGAWASADDTDAALQASLQEAVDRMRVQAVACNDGKADGGGGGGQEALPYPAWFFRPHWSDPCKAVLSGLLHPDPNKRWSVQQALGHEWVTNATARPAHPTRAQVEGITPPHDMVRSGAGEGTPTRPLR